MFQIVFRGVQGCSMVFQVVSKKFQGSFKSVEKKILGVFQDSFNED